MLKGKNKILSFLTLFLITVFANAQQNRVSDAYTFLQKGILDSAKIYINIAVTDSESINDGQAWYLRGFIYKSIYNKTEKANKQSPNRIEALNSFKRSMLIDTSGNNVIENLKNIKYLTTTLFNDVVLCLDTINYKTAISNFDLFKVYYRLVDTSQLSIKQYDIKFLKALASVYTQIYEKDKKANSEFLNLSKSTYTKVLALDPSDIGANYNMGILYYNQAVQLINQSDYDIDIVALNDIQDNSVKLFKESLPFMEKAYQLDPKRRETLLGLSGIYFSLNEKEKSDIYKQKLQEIK